MLAPAGEEEPPEQLLRIGALQTGALLRSLGGSYSKACTLVSLIYLVGVGVIWLAPETKGKPLPE